MMRRQRIRSLRCFFDIRDHSERFLTAGRCGLLLAGFFCLFLSSTAMVMGDDVRVSKMTSTNRIRSCLHLGGRHPEEIRHLFQRLLKSNRWRVCFDETDVPRHWMSEDDLKYLMTLLDATEPVPCVVADRSSVIRFDVDECPLGDVALFFLEWYRSEGGIMLSIFEEDQRKRLRRGIEEWWQERRADQRIQGTGRIVSPKTGKRSQRAVRE